MIVVCDKCCHKTGYTLSADECGAGSFFEYCQKGYWDGGGPTSQEEADLWETLEDPWKDCKDYCLNNKTKPL